MSIQPSGGLPTTWHCGGGWEEGVKVAREPIPIAMEMGDGLFPWQQHTGPILLPLGVGDPNVFSIASGCRGGALSPLWESC